MDTVHKQHVGQLFGNIPLVSEELAKYGFEKRFVFKGFPVVNIFLGDCKSLIFRPDH